MERDGYDELLEEQGVPLIEWEFAPVGTAFYAEDYFRNSKGNWWDEDTNIWRDSFYDLEQLLRARDYQLNPSIPQYDESIDDKWENGELGRDEEFVKVSEQSEALSNLLKEATNIASNGGTFIQVVPSDTPKTSIQFLDEVKQTQSERAVEYEQDGGERSFAKIATVFNTYRGKDLVPSDIALILEILKNVRFYSQDGYHRDSVVDKISYGSLWAELVTEERT